MDVKKLDEWINKIKREEQTNVLNSITIYNNIVENIIEDNSIYLCLYTCYIDCIKANIIYSGYLNTRNKLILVYYFYVILYSLILFTFGFMVGQIFVG